jgi:hypothetical protein
VVCMTKGVQLINAVNAHQKHRWLQSWYNGRYIDQSYIYSSYMSPYIDRYNRPYTYELQQKSPISHAIFPS